MLPAISMVPTVIAFNSSDNAPQRAREFHLAIKSVYVIGGVTVTVSVAKRGVNTAEAMDAIFFAVIVKTVPYADGLACKIITCLSVCLHMRVLVRLPFKEEFIETENLQLNEFSV